MNTFIMYKNLLSIKFILLLCGSIIFIIKTVSVYQEKHRSWNILTKVFYVLSMGLFAAEAIIVIMGVIGILVKDWDVIVIIIMVIDGIVGGMFMRELTMNHKPPVKRVVCRRAISPYHYDQRLKALAFTLFKPLCPSYSATP